MHSNEVALIPYEKVNNSTNAINVECECDVCTIQKGSVKDVVRKVKKKMKTMQEKTLKNINYFFENLFSGKMKERLNEREDKEIYIEDVYNKGRIVRSFSEICDDNVWYCLSGRNC